jgi:hypothetical protein
MSEEETAEMEEIKAGLVELLVGKNKVLSIVAAVSVAATAAHMVGMSKMDLQKLLIRMYDARVAEAQGESERVN